MQRRVAYKRNQLPACIQSHTEKAHDLLILQTICWLSTQYVGPAHSAAMVPSCRIILIGLHRLRGCREGKDYERDQLLAGIQSDTKKAQDQCLPKVASV